MSTTLTTEPTTAPRPILDAPPAITDLFRVWMWGCDVRTRYKAYHELLAELRYRYRSYFLTPTHVVWFGWGRVKSMPRSMAITREEYR